MKKITKAQLKKLSVMNLVGNIIEATNDSGDLLPIDALPYMSELGRRFDLTTLQASLLSVIIDQSDDNRIRPRDLARHYSIHTVHIIDKLDELDGMVSKGIIMRRKGNDGEVTYRILNKVIMRLKDGLLPEKEKVDGLSATEFMDKVSDMLHQRETDDLEDEDLYCKLHELIEQNQQLNIAQKLKAYALNPSDLVMFLAISMLFIENHDEHLMRGDLGDFFDRPDFRGHMHDFADGTHVLMRAKLVENAICDGQVDTEAWRLTEYAKQEVYPELNLKAPSNVRSNMTHYDEIEAKELFYTPKVSKQVEQLRSLLEHDRMSRILKRMGDKGMRKGFSCIFYGTPGTGKTATVLELARTTKRDIMVVDIPSIRSKWVGETEKNIQALFDRYRKVVQSSESAPILLFNEADAIFSKRNEGGTNAVDKMENAMQNIILQNLEDLEGIMIATTNLQGNMDPAMERRFLYKVEFDKPTPKERSQIWRSMLPDLTEEQATQLASRFDFSGGQIENIARKRVISDILNDSDELCFEDVVENCKTELLKKSTEMSKVGF